MAYITISQVRDEGLSEGDFSDPKVTAAIALCSAMFDRLTRQWFEPRSLTALLDGNGGDTLFLPVPVISISALYTNGEFTIALPADSYAVYNNRSEPSDDRWNPMIKLVKSTDIFAPFEDPQTPVFAAGRRNQKVIGKFGFTDDPTDEEPDGTTPLLVQRAILKMVIRNLTNPLYIATGSDVPSGGSGGVSGGGPVASETTDRHKIEYSTPKIGGVRAGSFNLTGDAEVEEIVAMYRAPRAIEASSDVLWLHAG